MTKLLLISKTRVKSFLKGEGLRVSTDYYGALNDRLIACIARSGIRAKSNRRLTVLGGDV